MAAMTEIGSNPSSSFIASDDWRDAYQEALFERDRILLRNRIMRAEALIAQRERFLFSSTLDIAERQSLNRAHQSLRALWICLGL
jgi:hypothetical protein